MLCGVRQQHPVSPRHPRQRKCYAKLRDSRSRGYGNALRVDVHHKRRVWTDAGVRVRPDLHPRHLHVLGTVSDSAADGATDVYAREGVGSR